MRFVCSKYEKMFIQNVFEGKKRRSRDSAFSETIVSAKCPNNNDGDYLFFMKINVVLDLFLCMPPIDVKGRH